MNLCSKLLIIVILIYRNLVYCDVYQISPSHSNCTHPNCLTLSELAINYTYELNTTLNFISEDHTLFSELLIANSHEVYFTSEYNANILCLPSASIQLLNISRLHISRIAFFHCSGIIIQSVSQFIILNSSFRDQNSRRSALSLDNSFGSIVGSLFLSNKHGTFKNSSLLNAHGRVGGAAIIVKSNVSLVRCVFQENSAEVGGAIYGEKQSNVTVSTSLFVRNSVSCSDDVKVCFGGALSIEDGTNLVIQDSNFQSNEALGIYASGGVLTAYDGKIIIKESNFSNNSAGDLGGVCVALQSILVITDTNFVYSRAQNVGGTIYLYSSSVTMIGGRFDSSMAHSKGGCIYALISDIQINETMFVASFAVKDGGAIYLNSLNTSMNLYGCKFYYNSAGYGGVLSMKGPGSRLDISYSEFINNTGRQNGGIAYIEQAHLISIVKSYFINNVAYRNGGVLYAVSSSLIIKDCNFVHCKAFQAGSVWYATATTVKTYGTILMHNNTGRLGVLYFIQSSVMFSRILNMSSNTGSLIARNSVVNLTGDVIIKNGYAKKVDLARTLFEGGAITALQSVLYFNGKRMLLTFNQAHIGGAIYASESKLYVYGELMISNNGATYNGGGIFLYLSELSFQPQSDVNISVNIASKKGGGVHAVSSVLKAHASYCRCHDICNHDLGASIYVMGNQAKFGGGVCLDANSKLYVLKKDWSPQGSIAFHFISNSADYGGALLVSDETNSGMCASTSYQMSTAITECFIQSIAQNDFALNTFIDVVSVKFINNEAYISGENLHGGLLDRCTVSPFAEVYSQRDQINHPYLQHSLITGVNYFTYITNIKSIDSISSYPVRICFCTHGLQNCDYNPPTLNIMKGERFAVHLIAVDQVNHTVSNATIKSSLKSYHSGLGEGQLIQMTSSACTDLYFNVFSAHDKEELNLYPEGPCKDVPLSQRRLSIQFLPCNCPIGLQPKVIETSSCVCECDSRLLHYITECNSITGILVREGYFWITFINTTENNITSTVGYFLIHPYCPFDYCKPPGTKTEINFNTKGGADAQCSHNRTGTLCGACQLGLSVSLGSSRCLQCRSNWPITLAATVVGAAVAGILLIAILLILNLTVAVGSLNSIIFYCNVIAAYKSTFFSSSETNFLTMFIAWINLEVGVDFCLFQGMDVYHKTWLELAFPIYVIFLVIAVIIISEHFTKFAVLIGRKNPVAVLSTLILLSYAKLLSIIITTLSFTVLKYPDGSQKVLWLPDASVFYLRGKHIPLFIVSLIILLCGIGYTTLIFTWQWLFYHQDKRIIRWISGNLKIAFFIETYLAPHTFKHRYWTGLILFTRVVLSIISAVNTSSNPSINILVIGTVMTFLLFLRSCLPGNIYKKKTVDILELLCLLNIIVLCFATFFVNISVVFNQAVASYLSASITLLLFICVITYHVLFEFCLKTKCINNLVKQINTRRHSQLVSEDVEGPLLNMQVDVASMERECTMSVVDAPPRDELPLSHFINDVST